MKELKVDFPKDYFVTDGHMDVVQVFFDEYLSMKEQDKYHVAFSYEGNDYDFPLKDSNLTNRLETLAGRFPFGNTYISLEEVGAWNLELVSLEKQFNTLMDSTLEPLEQGVIRDILVAYTNRNKRDFKSFLDTIRDLLDISLQGTDIEKIVR